MFYIQIRYIFTLKKYINLPAQLPGRVGRYIYDSGMVPETDLNFYSYA